MNAGDLDMIEVRAERLDLQVAPSDILRLVAEVRELRAKVAQARTWIVNCVDPAEVGVEAKRRMLDALDDA